MPIPLFGLAALVVLFYPLVEIAGFMFLGAHIGIAATLLIQIAVFAIGGLTLKHGGIRFIRRIAGEVEAGRVPTTAMIEGLLLMIAGVVMVLPGLVKDILILPLFLASVRRFLARTVVTGGGATFYGRVETSAIVDLDKSQFRRHRSENDSNEIRRIDPDHPTG